MYDLWVETKKTKESWRVDNDPSKMVYINEEGTTVFNCDVSEIQFYPCCPREAPQNEVKETGEQMTIWEVLNEH